MISDQETINSLSAELRAMHERIADLERQLTAIEEYARNLDFATLDKKGGK